MKYIVQLSAAGCVHWTVQETVEMFTVCSYVCTQLRASCTVQCSLRTSVHSTVCSTVHIGKESVFSEVLCLQRTLCAVQYNVYSALHASSSSVGLGLVDSNPVEPPPPPPAGEKKVFLVSVPPSAHARDSVSPLCRIFLNHSIYNFCQTTIVNLGLNYHIKIFWFKY